MGDCQTFSVDYTGGSRFLFFVLEVDFGVLVIRGCGYIARN